jgi:hypothetical protein
MVSNFDITSSLIGFYNEYDEMFCCEPSLNDCVDFICEVLDISATDEVIEQICIELEDLRTN